MDVGQNPLAEVGVRKPNVVLYSWGDRREWFLAAFVRSAECTAFIDGLRVAGEPFIERIDAKRYESANRMIVRVHEIAADTMEQHGADDATLSWDRPA